MKVTFIVRDFHHSPRNTDRVIAPTGYVGVEEKPGSKKFTFHRSLELLESISTIFTSYPSISIVMTIMPACYMIHFVL